MINVFLWGSGYISDTALTGVETNHKHLLENQLFHIHGIIDNNPQKWGTAFHGFPIVKPAEAMEKGYDYIIILTDTPDEIRDQLIYGYHQEPRKIKEKWFFLQLLMTVKYKDSQDKEIRDTITWWREHDLTMFNQTLPSTGISHEVRWEKSNNLPYIEFIDIVGKNRKMYFPRDYKFDVKNKIQYLDDILTEQQAGSPHLYSFGNHAVKEGDVVIDGGVCEGNFALRYVDYASFLYLFEPDPRWAEANYYTFRPYEDRVEIIHKGLSNRCGKNTITIDSVIGSGKRLDFLKLDIESYEVPALEGGEKTLTSNDVNPLSVVTIERKMNALYGKD